MTGYIYAAENSNQVGYGCRLMSSFNAPENPGLDKNRNMVGENRTDDEDSSHIELLSDEDVAPGEVGQQGEYESDICTSPEGLSDVSLRAVSTAGTFESDAQVHKSQPSVSGDDIDQIISLHNTGTEPENIAKTETVNQSEERWNESQSQGNDNTNKLEGEASSSTHEHANPGFDTGQSSVVGVKIPEIKKAHSRSRDESGIPSNSQPQYLDARSWHDINSSVPRSNNGNREAASGARFSKYRSSEVSINEALWDITVQSSVGEIDIPRAVSRSAFGGSSTLEISEVGIVQPEDVAGGAKREVLIRQETGSPLPSECLASDVPSLVALETSLDSFRRVSESQGSHSYGAGSNSGKTQTSNNDVGMALWSDATVYPQSDRSYTQGSEHGHQGQKNALHEHPVEGDELADFEGDFASQWFNLLLEDCNGDVVKVGGKLCTFLYELST